MSPSVELRLPPGLQQAVAEVCPRLWRVLSDARRTTVGSHAEAVWRRAAAMGEPRHLALKRARLAVRESLASAMLSRSAVDAQAALNQFDRFPLLQTADHAQLILDPVSFYTNLPFQIGARRVGAQFLFVNACSTVTLETRTATGPGWLNVAGHRINVFGVPRKKLSRSSVCGLLGPLRFELRHACATGVSPSPASMGETGDLEGWLDRLRALTSGSFATAAEAFREANERLWRSWDAAHDSTLVYTDDRLTAAVVDRNLDDADGPLHRVLFEPALRVRFQAALSQARIGIGRLALPPSTDFFWGLRAGRVRMLRVIDGWLREPDRPDGLCFRFDRTAISAGLRSGILYPDLCVGFLALAILPRVAVTGGSSQLIYVPMIADALKLTLRSVSDLRDLCAELSDEANDAWMAGMIEADEHPLPTLATAEQGAGLRALGDRWADVPLASSVGTGRLFRYLEIWKDAVP